MRSETTPTAEASDAPVAAHVRQQHTADEIAFALENVLDGMDPLPSVADLRALTAESSTRDLFVLTRFFTRLGQV